jgi:hypothetical protein
MTSTAAKTSRIPDRYASQGAVRQNGGNLPLYTCNACGGEVVWAESKRTGRKYLCTVRKGYHGQRYYVGADVHPRDCAEQRAARDAEYEAIVTAQELSADYVTRIQAARKSGNLELADRLLDEWSDLD